MKHLSLNLAIAFFFAGIGSTICTVIYHVLGGTNQILGTSIPLIIWCPFGLLIYAALHKFAMQPLYEDYRQKIHGMRLNNILTPPQEKRLLSRAGTYNSYCHLWIFASSWLVIPVVCYCVAFWFLRVWIDKTQTAYE